MKGYACGVNKKRHILVNSGQFKDETPRNLKFFECEISKQITERHYVILSPYHCIFL